MGRKVDGKKMNRKQKKFLEDDTEAETQDSKHLDETQNERGFQINRKASEAHKNDIKINKECSFCMCTHSCMELSYNTCLEETKVQAIPILPTPN